MLAAITRLFVGERENVALPIVEAIGNPVSLSKTAEKDMRGHGNLETRLTSDFKANVECAVPKLDCGLSFNEENGVKIPGGHKAPFQSNTSGPDHKSAANVNGSLRAVHCPELTQITPALIPSPDMAGECVAPFPLTRLAPDTLE